MRVLTISFMIAGIFFLTLASGVFVASGMHWESSDENQKQQASSLLFIGTVILVFGIVFISVSFYGSGIGRPRFLSHAEVNSIFEVIGRVSVGEGKIITVLKEQKNSKMRLFELESVPETKFVKVVIKPEGGKRALEPFPPKEITSPDETALGAEVPLLQEDS